MALATEHVRATPQGLEYRPPGYESPRSLAWHRLRAISAQIEPAWSGAEVSVELAFEGEEAPRAPLGSAVGASRRAGGANAPRDAMGATSLGVTAGSGWPEGPEPNAIPLAGGTVFETFGPVLAARAIIEAAHARAPQALVGLLAQLLAGLSAPESQDERWYRQKERQYAFGAEAGLSLGKLHLWRGRLKAADNDFQRVVARAPLDATAWRLLGLARLLAGKGDGAQEALERLIALGARDAEALYLHALAVYRQRRFAQAGEELAGLARARPDDPGVRDLLACCLVQQWRTDEALREIDSVGADRRQGWRLMAQKCRICARGHQAYQERLAREPQFRWSERWKRTMAYVGAAVGGLYPLAQALVGHRWWELLGAFILLAAGIYMWDRVRVQHRVLDQLADAQGQAPNMPCWYASLVWGHERSHGRRQSLLRGIRRRFQEE